MNNSSRRPLPPDPRACVTPTKRLHMRNEDKRIFRYHTTYILLNGHLVENHEKSIITKHFVFEVVFHHLRPFISCLSLMDQALPITCNIFPSIFLMLHHKPKNLFSSSLIVLQVDVWTDRGIIHRFYFRD